MVIKVSSGRQLDRLIADLGSDRAVAREAAIALIAVIGERAVERLISVIESSASALSRVSALRALEAIGGSRGLEVALEAVEDRNANVAIAAIGVARTFVNGTRGVAAVDRLTSVAMDRARPQAVRGAALRTLEALNPKTVAPLREALKNDPEPAVAALAGGNSAGLGEEDLAATVTAAAEETLPDDPEWLRGAIAASADAVPLAALRTLVERVREREAAESGARRALWTRVRGTAHVALAERDSRLALYDLRESLESAVDPLPVEFLAAIRRIGDQSCLEPLAIACSLAPRGDDWWRRHLLDAFRAIVARERITRRHSVMKRIALRSPDILRDFR